MAEKYVYKIGRRKTSVATVRLYSDAGQSIINGKPVTEYYPEKLDQEKLTKPFDVLELKPSSFYYTVQVKGGGTSSQLGAITLGISRALTEISAENRTPLKRAGLLTRDPRMVERKKTGQRKARKKEQYSKR
jgi:small subunit ribosomal protein S9